jgi:hypothetical protein
LTWDLLFDVSGPRPYRLVTVPYSGNPNIEAQKGLFTILTPSKITLDAEIDRRPFDEVLSAEAQSHWSEATSNGDFHLFQCFTLETGQAFECIRLLAKHGVCAASVFPGFKGVCDTVFEKHWWWTKCP